MKILITQLGRIGDMILLTPMFSIIKEHYPDSMIDVICGTKNHIILKNNPNIHSIYIFDKSPLKLIEFLVKIRKNKYDYYIDPKDHFSKESSILAGFVKASNKIGFNANEKSNFNLSIPTNKENIGIHYSAKILNPLSHLIINIRQSHYKPVLFESPESIEYVKEFLIRNSLHQYIVINISASQERKMWEIDKWIEFIKKIQNILAAKGLEIVITSAPTEAENVNHIVSKTQRIIHFKSRIISDVISLLKLSHLLVTPDTALVHIAASFNVKILGLYANNPVFYSMFYPLSDCFEVVFTQAGVENIKEINVDKVLESFLKLSDKL